MLRIVGRNIFTIDKQVVGTYKKKKYYAMALYEVPTSIDDDGSHFVEGRDLWFGENYRLWEIGLYRLTGAIRKAPDYTIEVLVHLDLGGRIVSRLRMYSLSFLPLKSKSGTYRVVKTLVMEGNRSISADKAKKEELETTYWRRIGRKLYA
jgi:hypothetical protein